MDARQEAESYIGNQELPSEDKLWKVEELLRQFHSEPVWYGIQCQSGWIDTIYQIHESILMVYPEYRITQIKQKFGTLRFYIDQYPKYNTIQNFMVTACIRYGEHLSQHTCERCGTPHRNEDGIMRTVELRTHYGWAHTYCDQCELDYVNMKHSHNHFNHPEDHEYRKFLEKRINSIK